MFPGTTPNMAPFTLLPLSRPPRRSMLPRRRRTRHAACSTALRRRASSCASNTCHVRGHVGRRTHNLWRRAAHLCARSGLPFGSWRSGQGSMYAPLEWPSPVPRGRDPTGRKARHSWPGGKRSLGWALGGGGSPVQAGTPQEAGSPGQGVGGSPQLRGRNGDRAEREPVVYAVSRAGKLGSWVQSVLEGVL